MILGKTLKITALLIIIGLSFKHYYLSIDNKELQDRVVRFQRENRVLKDSVRLLDETSVNQYLYEGLRIDRDIVVLDEQNKQIKLSELINNNSKLVFRFTEINCNVCSEFQFQLIKRFLRRNEKEGVIVLASYRSKRDLMIFKQLNQVNIPIYRVDKKQLNSSIENLNFPYYFVLNRQFVMRKVHLPAKEFPIITNEYLKMISRILYDKNRPVL